MIKRVSKTLVTVVEYRIFDYDMKDLLQGSGENMDGLVEVEPEKECETWAERWPIVVRVTKEAWAERWPIVVRVTKEEEEESEA